METATRIKIKIKIRKTKGMAIRINKADTVFIKRANSLLFLFQGIDIGICFPALKAHLLI
jgi:hypothetical protein